MWTKRVDASISLGPGTRAIKLLMVVIPDSIKEQGKTCFFMIELVYSRYVVSDYFDRKKIMGAKKGLLRGNKISHSHSSMIAPAEGLVALMKDQPEVKKVVLGIIKRVKCSPGVKVLEEGPAILRVTIRGSASMQILWVYLQNPSDVKKVSSLIENTFSVAGN